MIRKATLDDIDAALVFAREFCESHPRKIAYCEESARKTLQTLIEHDDAVLFISDSGFFGASIQPVLFNSQYRQAVEHFWWGDRLMLRHYERWAASRGVDAIGVGTTHGIGHERVETHYRKRGFIPAEHSFVKDMCYESF